MPNETTDTTQATPPPDTGTVPAIEPAQGEELRPPAAQSESVKPKAILLEDIIPAQQLEIIKLVPKNPIVQGLIMKYTGLPIPATMQTFEEIREYVEGMISKGKSPQQAKPFIAGVSVPCSLRETEYGIIKYRVERKGTLVVEWTAEEIKNLAEQHSNFESLLEEFGDTTEENAKEDCDNWEADWGNAEYFDTEPDDCEDNEVMISHSQIKVSVMKLLSDNWPDIYQRLLSGSM
jgi:hypothetical protein